MTALPITEIIQARDISADIGKKTLPAERKRHTVADIFYANSQRVKESLRVLEEFTKLLNSKSALELKKLRNRNFLLFKIDDFVSNYL